MGNTPPGSPGRNHLPLLFAPQVPVAPLQRGDGHPFFNQISQNESSGVDHRPTEGIPTIITWNYGGNEVAIEGSWDNWTSRKILQRSGKDHSIILILPAGIYHYKFVVDGQWRYTPDVPFVADVMGYVCNLLDVNAYLPEFPDSVAEFEAPPSPDSSYSQALPTNEDFVKEPLTIPPQLHLTVLGMESSNEASSSKPQHVLLNHLFIEIGGASPSIVALGMTHRFQFKYVTMVLFKPLKRRLIRGTLLIHPFEKKIFQGTEKSTRNERLFEGLQANANAFNLRISSYPANTPGKLCLLYLQSKDLLEPRGGGLHYVVFYLPAIF